MKVPGSVKFDSLLLNLLGNGKDIVDPSNFAASVNTGEIEDLITISKSENNEDATELLYGKLYALTEQFKSNDINDDSLEHFNLDPFNTAMCSFVYQPEGGGLTFTDNSAPALADLISNDASAENPAIHLADSVSLGKILMSFIGHSLSVSGLFDEVQMVFYPLNHKSGGARRHTTASLPIPKQVLREVVIEKISKSPNLSISGFFSLLERKIIRDELLPIYGISSLTEKFNEKIERLKTEREVIAGIKELSDDQKSRKEEILAEIKLARDKLKDDISEHVQKIYHSDNGPTVESVFVRPNLSMYMEVLIPQAPPEDVFQTDGSVKTPQFKKNICRVHIYDEETVSRPFESMLNDVISEGGSGRAFVKSASDPKALESILSEQKIEYDSKVIGKKPFKDSIVNLVNKVDATTIKKIIKRSYPSITYGTSTGVIKNISVSSNVSSAISQAIMVSSFANKRNPQDGRSGFSEIEEMTVVPATIEIDMLGNPFIQRGNQIYIDFGTNTTLDNIYTVKTVRHEISAGSFTTKLSLMFAGQGSASNVRTSIVDAINRIK